MSSPKFARNIFFLKGKDHDAIHESYAPTQKIYTSIPVSFSGQGWSHIFQADVTC